MRAGAVLAAVVICALIMRAVPALVSGEPFSVDVWPLIKGSHTLLRDPATRLWDDSAFDGYNNRWPGMIVFGYIYSVVTGAPLRRSYRLDLTAALAYATAIALYALLRRFFSPGASAVGTALALFMPSFLVLTSSPLKEVLAYPIMITAATVSGSRVDRASVPLIMVLVAGSVVTHHLATIMLSGVLLSIYYVFSVYVVKGVIRGWSGKPLSCLVLPIMALLSLTTYYLVFGGAGKGPRLGLTDAVSFVFYLVVAYVGLLLALGRGGARPLILALTSSVIAALLARYFLLLPGVTVPSASIIWYVVPVAAAVTALSWGVRDARIRAIVVGSGTFILVATAYSVVGNPLLSTAAHRLINYVFVPLSFLAAYWASVGGRARKVAASASAALAITASIFVILGILAGTDASSYWLYSKGEVGGFTAVAKLSGGRPLVGDDKVRYFLSPEARVDPVPALKAAYLREPLPRGSVLVTYEGNNVLGFVVGLSVYDIRVLVSGSSGKVFDNGYVRAFLGGGGA